VEIGRQMLDKEQHGVVDKRVTDHMVIVQHEDDCGMSLLDFSE
jgi:hypothetical protein